MNDLVIQKLDTARLALVEADIYQTKNILDVAVAMETYAKRQKLGEEAIHYATSIKVEALAQLGRMLKATQRNTGSRLIGGSEEYSGGSKVVPPDDIPTLAEMGLDKKTSKLAQDIAGLPEEQVEKVKQGVITLHKAQKATKTQQREKERAKIAEAGASVEPSVRWNVWQADIRTWNVPRQYDFIITDPPYPKEYLPLWETLAIRAKEWLKPGGLLIAMSGQSYLNEIYAMFDKHLKYYWTGSYLTPGQTVSLWQKQVITNWKPVLIYSVGDYKDKIFSDVFKSDANEKEFHKWGQSESGMLSIIKQICLPGQTILDPFCGAGTTGIAALEHGCLFDGIDIDIESVNISKARLNDRTTAR